MDPQVQALINVVQMLVTKVGLLTDKVDGLLCHFSSIDADYTRMRGTVVNHEERIRRLEQEHNFAPDDHAVGAASAVFPAIKVPPS